jgi:hypothetical protein
VLDEAVGVVADDPRRRGKLSREREAELVAGWRDCAPSADMARAREVKTP